MIGDYTYICRLNDLEENRTTAAEAKGKSILLCKIDGVVFAVENRCTHENSPIGERDIYKGEIQCPRHGARFDIKTGRATQIPAVVDIKTFGIKIENNKVFVDVD